MHAKNKFRAIFNSFVAYNYFWCTHRTFTYQKYNVMFDTNATAGAAWGFWYFEQLHTHKPNIYPASQIHLEQSNYSIIVKAKNGKWFGNWYPLRISITANTFSSLIKTHLYVFTVHKTTIAISISLIFIYLENKNIFRITLLHFLKVKFLLFTYIDVYIIFYGGIHVVNNVILQYS